jgi:hypothetical protein
MPKRRKHDLLSRVTSEGFAEIQVYDAVGLRAALDSFVTAAGEYVRDAEGRVLVFEIMPGAKLRVYPVNLATFPDERFPMEDGHARRLMGLLEEIGQC